MQHQVLEWVLCVTCAEMQRVQFSLAVFSHQSIKNTQREAWQLLLEWDSVTAVLISGTSWKYPNGPTSTSGPAFSGMPGMPLLTYDCLGTKVNITCFCCLFVLFFANVKHFLYCFFNYNNSFLYFNFRNNRLKRHQHVSGWNFCDYKAKYKKQSYLKLIKALSNYNKTRVQRTDKPATIF